MELTDKESLYLQFAACTVKELEALLLATEDADEKAFYRALINLKLQISQSHVVGKALV